MTITEEQLILRLESLECFSDGRILSFIWEKLARDSNPSDAALGKEIHAAAAALGEIMCMYTTARELRQLVRRATRAYHYVEEGDKL